MIYIYIKIKSNLRRKKHHRTNQGYNFLGGSFSYRDSVRVLIQVRRERSQHLKRWFFFKNKLIYFYISITRIVRSVKRVFPVLKSSNHFLLQSGNYFPKFLQMPLKFLRFCIELKSYFAENGITSANGKKPKWWIFVLGLY